MKLDTKVLRYLTNDDWRTLTAVEQGSRNHEVVPTPLIQQIAGIRGASARCISTLAKANLIGRQKNVKYDGYMLKYGGLDYLAIHSHLKQDVVYSVGNQIGVGKESDIIAVADTKGEQYVLKIHRLGRISFRTVKANRDYLRKRSTGSWMYMSRLAAMKEHAFMSALYDVGFPVPRPIAQNRHTIVMEMIDAFPLRQIDKVSDPPGLYSELMELILRLAGVGLIHGDFNEFNLLIKEEEITKEEATASSQDASETASKVKLIPIVIDFPQMVSVDHPNAEMYFDRDVECIRRFFQRRYGFTSDARGPFFKDGRKRLKKGGRRLDVEVEASGFSRKQAKELEQYMQAVGVKGDGEKPDSEDEESEGSEDGDEEEDDSDKDRNGLDNVGEEEDRTRPEDGVASNVAPDTAEHQNEVHNTVKALDGLGVNG